MIEPFSSLEMERLAGVSARQLQWWDEKRVVKPSREKLHRRRSYTGEQAVLVLITAELRRKGLSLQKVRRLVRSIEKKVTQVSELAATRLCLVTDGSAVGYAEENALLPLCSRARRALHVVSLGDKARLIENARAFARAS